MPDTKKTVYRLGKLSQEFNVSASTIINFLKARHQIALENNPNAKVDQATYDLLVKEYNKGAASISHQKKEVTARKTLTLQSKKELEIEEPDLDQKKNASKHDLISVEIKDFNKPKVLDTMDLVALESKKGSGTRQKSDTKKPKLTTIKDNDWMKSYKGELSPRQALERFHKLKAEEKKRRLQEELKNIDLL